LSHLTELGRAMISFLTKSCYPQLAVGLSVIAVSLFAAEPRYIKPTKMDLDRKAAENKRKSEEAQREAKAAQQAQTQQSSENPNAARRLSSAESSSPTFDPAGAPPPEECLQAFLSSAKSASSMNQILSYLPQQEQERLKARQSRFNPQQAVKTRETIRKLNPKASAEELAHITESPYNHALKVHRDMASSVIRITGVKVDGDRATVTVSTNHGATINGERYDYGTATVKMVGEGRTWKVADFDTSIMVYKEAP
jgi:hypothetical protein